MVNLLVNAHTCDRTIGRAWIECVWSKSGFCATAGKVGHPFLSLPGKRILPHLDHERTEVTKYKVLNF